MSVKRYSTIFTWIPVGVWASVILVLSVLPGIFIFSAMPFDKGQVVNITRNLAQVLHLTWIAGHWDKVAHFSGYAVLGVLIVSSFYIMGIRSLSKNVSFSFMLGGGYGVFTEAFQKYCPSRTVSLMDACANIAGLTSGIIFCVLTIYVLKTVFLSAVSHQLSTVSHV